MFLYFICFSTENGVVLRIKVWVRPLYRLIGIHGLVSVHEMFINEMNKRVLKPKTKSLPTLFI